MFAITTASVTIAAWRQPQHHPPTWQSFAACRGLDPDLFHGTIDQMRQAQHVCASCPVAEMCPWTALVYDDPAYRYGVSGGLLSHQRRQLVALWPPRRAAELLEVELAWWAA